MSVQIKGATEIGTLQAERYSQEADGLLWGGRVMFSQGNLMVTLDFAM